MSLPPLSFLMCPSITSLLPYSVLYCLWPGRPLLLCPVMKLLRSSFGVTSPSPPSLHHHSLILLTTTRLFKDVGVKYRDFPHSVLSLTKTQPLLSLEGGEYRSGSMCPSLLPNYWKYPVLLLFSWSAHYWPPPPLSTAHHAMRGATGHTPEFHPFQWCAVVRQWYPLVLA